VPAVGGPVAPYRTGGGGVGCLSDGVGAPDGAGDHDARSGAGTTTTV